MRTLVGNTGQDLTRLDLNDVVQDILPLMRREIQDHLVSLRLELAPGLPVVDGDRVQLQQVIINFVINGVQAMATINDRPRRLVIRTQPGERGDVVLTVQDAGPGIAPDSASRLFEAFFTTKSDGMGMGLAICRSIIEAHGGQVGAKPASDSPGATFWFRLPASAPPGAIPP
jgi:C4-dicarboxylate-specific signal transduction histidine kinase